MSKKTTIPEPARVAALFDRLADSYDGAATRFFPFCADRLVDRMGLRPGLKVLDVGTGTGALAVGAAQRVRPDGRVMAIDLSGRMLDQAHENSRRLGLKNLDLHDMDAGNLEFRSAYFDVLLSGFVLFFLADMEAALREWRRVLKPGGRIGISVFEPGAFEPMSGLFRRRLAGYLEDVAPEQPFLWERLAEEASCRKLFEQAGFAEIDTESVEVGFRIERPLDWWELLWRTGYRAYLDRLAESELLEFQAEHLAEVEALFEEGVLRIPVPARLILARCPEAD